MLILLQICPLPGCGQLLTMVSPPSQGCICEEYKRWGGGGGGVEGVPLLTGLCPVNHQSTNSLQSLEIGTGLLGSTSLKTSRP